MSVTGVVSAPVTQGRVVSDVSVFGVLLLFVAWKIFPLSDLTQPM